MADPKTVLPEALKRLEFCVTNVDEAMYWLAQQVNGHPRAQDFEPSGHSGSGSKVPLQFDKDGWVRPDNAAAAGKEFRRQMTIAFNAICRMEATIAENLGAVRPKFDPTDPAEYCRMHLQLDEYLYRYRGDRCRSCYERVLTLRDNRLPDDITLDDLRYHQGHGRWPAKAVDPNKPAPMVQPLPKASRDAIAGTDRLTLGTEALDATTAAERLA